MIDKDHNVVRNENGCIKFRPGYTNKETGLIQKRMKKLRSNGDPAQQNDRFWCPGCKVKVFKNTLLQFSTKFRNEEGNLIATNWGEIQSEVTEHIMGKEFPFKIERAVIKNVDDLETWWRHTKKNLNNHINEHLDANECSMTKDEFMTKFEMFKKRR